MNSELGAFVAPENFLRHDFHRLQRQWVRLQRVAPERRDADMQRWRSAVDAARQRFLDP